MFDSAFLRIPDPLRGVLVVADVHGHADRLQAYREFARAHALYLVSLGDLVDRGPDSAGALRVMRGIDMRGEGLFLRGNHDDKLYRTLLGRPTHLDPELARTLAELRAAPDREEIESWFRDAYPRMPFVLRFGDTVLVHGAVTPDMLPPRHRLEKPQRLLALYGQRTGERTAEGRPVRIYRWLDELPEGLLVVAGHDPLSGSSLLLRRSARGARLLHLDAGAGQGGPLAAARLAEDGRLCETSEIAPGGRVPERCAIEPFAPGSGG